MENDSGTNYETESKTSYVERDDEITASVKIYSELYGLAKPKRIIIKARITENEATCSESE